MSRPTARWVCATWLTVMLLAAVAAPVWAQFGRNKLQYEAFEFQVLQTAHFDIYYYPRERDAALDAARMAERAYARLSRVLVHQFDERKPIILYASHSQFQQTNALPGLISEGTGGVTEFAKRRVIMPFTGAYAEFEHVLTHELVHAFQYDVIARGVAGQLNPLNFDLPLWFVEGMAEYLAIGELDTHTHAWVRDAVLSGYLRTIPEMSRYNDYLSYRFGQSLWAFIGAKFGDEAVGLLLQRATRMGIEAAFEVTLGYTVPQLSSEWIESIRTTYIPQAARFADPGQPARRITSHAFRPGADEFASYLSPALSPDGSQVVYVSDRGSDLYAFFDLWLASAETGAVQARLVKSARSPDFESLRFMQSSAAWSSDGRYVAFVAQVAGRDALYVYDVRRRRVAQKITAELDGMRNPSFSPDGMRIAFTGLQGGISDLYVIDVAGRKLRRLTSDRYADLHPAWSPDGRYIAIATDRGEDTDFERLVFGDYRIALYSVGSGDIELLPLQEGKNINPAWSPDGTAIAFVSDRGGNNNVFLWSLSEERLYQVTDVLSGVTGIIPSSPSISWAAREDRLAFTYFEGAGYNIYVIDGPKSVARPVPLPVTVPAPIAARQAPFAESKTGPAAATASVWGVFGDAILRADSRPASLSVAPGAGRSFYRSGGVLRPSDSVLEVEQVEVERELTIAQLLEDASIGLPDTAGFGRSEYEVKLTPEVIGQPVIGGQVGGDFGNGVYGGSYVLLSDMLGDHNLLLWGQIAGSLDDAYVLTQYAYLRERVNVSMSYQQYPLYQFRGSAMALDPGANEYYENRFIRDVYRILSTELSYPFNTFERLEISAVGAYVSRDSVVDRFVVNSADGIDRDTRRMRNLVFAGPSIALVRDNSLFGYTGPISGQRHRIGIGRYFGDVAVTSLTVDLRNYLNLGGQFAIATRLTGISRSGHGEDEFRVYWGGPYFVRGYDGGSFNSTECIESAKRVQDPVTTLCPVRDQLIGSSIAFAAAEFRFPVFTFLDLGFVPLGLPPVDGALFYDIGVAFNRFGQLSWSRQPGTDPVDVRSPVSSVGVGLRVNILYNVFRLDYALPLSRPDHRGGVWSVSFGPAF